MGSSEKGENINMDCGTGCEESTTDLDKALEGLSDNHRKLFHALFKESGETEGLLTIDTIDLFVALKKDARLLSLIELAMSIDSDDLDQLVFTAEDYYAQAVVTCSPEESGVLN
ncbi:MAG: hypothetical protein AAFU41_16705 [Pseudomonadota bacterium]